MILNKIGRFINIVVLLIIVHDSFAIALKAALSIVARKVSIGGRLVHARKIVQQMTLIYAPSDNDAKKITQSPLIQSSVGFRKNKIKQNCKPQ